MTTTDIRRSLTEVRDAVDVPRVDRLAFQRRVRSERRRRAAVRVLAVAGTTAATVAIAALAIGVGPGSDRSVDTGPADRPAATGTVAETVFFVLDGRLTALDPAGQVHDLGVRAEGVVGFTSERVYAVDDESNLVVRTVSYDDESGRASFGREESPVSGPVQTAALSGDGRYLAWTDIDDVSHRYDLKAGREDLTIPDGPASSLWDVSAAGLLLQTSEGVVLRDADSEVPISVPSGGAAVDEVAGPLGAAEPSQMAGDLVLVNGRDGRTRLYDLAGGVAREVGTLGGFGVLGPYAERVGVLVPEPADRVRLEVWDGGSSRPVTGLEGEIPAQVRWADETTMLVTAHEGRHADLFACDIELACRRLPVDGEVSLTR